MNHRVSTYMWVLAAGLLNAVLVVHAVNIDTAFDPAKLALEDIVEKIEKVKDTIKQLARQTMSQQLFVEERIRSDGHSGFKQLRSTVHGTDSYFDSSYISKAVIAIHDHSNTKNMIGLGEAIVVLNGVEFRTKHNDYFLKCHDSSTSEFDAVKDVPFPKIPPEVSRKKTLEEQVEEMRQWFIAFSKQDYKKRDYRKYFRPLMCILEGWWEVADQQGDESFSKSTREDGSTVEAWRDLEQRIRFTSYSGAKSLTESLAFLPTTISGINETTGEPLLARWNYRVLCHPFSGDIPTKYFKMQDDLAYRQATHRPKSRVKWTRAARFRLTEFDTNQYTKFTLLDKIMAEIAGKDKKRQNYEDDPMGQKLYSATNRGRNKELKTGYYHRLYRTESPCLSGTTLSSRGFSDEMLFVAQTTHKRVAPMAFPFCSSRNRCIDKETRFTYAIPLEVIYMTPLLTWNPFNLKIWDDPAVPTSNGRRGSLTKHKALNGTSYFRNYYLTPQDLFFTDTPDEEDPADTVKSSVGVLDQKGNVRKTVASGTRIVLPTISGAGRVRLRYPIIPLHIEGSAIWKELEVVKMKLELTKSEMQHAGMRSLNMHPTPISGTHIHDFYLSQDKYEAAMAGQVVSATTSVENGHNHHLDLTYNNKTGHLEYVRCGNESRCWDQHPRILFVRYTPGED